MSRSHIGTYRAEDTAQPCIGQPRLRDPMHACIRPRHTAATRPLGTPPQPQQTSPLPLPLPLARRAARRARTSTSVGHLPLWGTLRSSRRACAPGSERGPGSRRARSATPHAPARGGGGTNRAGRAGRRQRPARVVTTTQGGSARVREKKARKCARARAGRAVACGPAQPVRMHHAFRPFDACMHPGCSRRGDLEEAASRGCMHALLPNCMHAASRACGAAMPGPMGG